MGLEFIWSSKSTVVTQDLRLTLMQSREHCALMDGRTRVQFGELRQLLMRLQVTEVCPDLETKDVIGNVRGTFETPTLKDLKLVRRIREARISSRGRAQGLADSLTVVGTTREGTLERLLRERPVTSTFLSVRSARKGTLENVDWEQTYVSGVVSRDTTFGIAQSPKDGQLPRTLSPNPTPESTVFVRVRLKPALLQWCQVSFL